MTLGPSSEESYLSSPRCMSGSLGIAMLNELFQPTLLVAEDEVFRIHL